MQNPMPQAVQAGHERLVWLIPQLDKFPRLRRFTLGERIERVMLDVLESLVEAAFTRVKREPLQRANLRLEVLRHLWRVAFEQLTSKHGKFIVSPLPAMMRRLMAFEQW